MFVIIIFSVFIWQIVSDMVRVDNNTGIPLEVRFTVDDEEDNFTLIHGHSGWNSIEKKPSSTLSVKYTPNITEKRIKSQNARVIVEYQDHPKTASIRTIHRCQIIDLDFYFPITWAFKFL